MTRIMPRLYPRAKLYRLPQPAHPPFAVSWVSDQLLQQMGSRPAGRYNVDFVDLEKIGSEQDFDGMPGMPSKILPRAMVLDSTTEWVDTAVGGTNGWTREPTPGEKEWRQRDYDFFLGEVARINAIITEKKEKKQDTADDEALLLDAEIIVQQLSEGESGYFKTGFNLLDTGASGILWDLQAPNVPVRMTSTFTMDENRSIAFRLLREKAPKGQVRHEYKMFFENDLGAKSTCYALVIGEDGTSSEFWHFRNLKPGQRKKWLEQLDALKLKAKPDAEEQAQLDQWVEDEKAIRAAAKKTKQKLTKADNAAIKKLKDDAKALKDANKLTASDREAIKTLENNLFIEQKTFRLN